MGSLLLDQAPSIVTHAAIYVTWRHCNACGAAQVGVLVSLVCSCVLVLVAVLANKWMAPARSRDIVRIPLFSGPYMRWLAAQHATRAAAQAVAAYGAGTPLLAAFYGACGAAVGLRARVLFSRVARAGGRVVRVGRVGRGGAWARWVRWARGPHGPRGRVGRVGRGSGH